MNSLKINKSVIELILHSAGIGWLLQSYTKKEKKELIDKIIQEINDLSVELNTRLLPEKVNIISKLTSNPDHFRPLIQLFALPTSATIKSMVYFVLRGFNIKSINFKYEIRKPSNLTIILSDPQEKFPDATFETNNFYDAEVLKHLGSMTINGSPMFCGYYAND